MSGFLNAVVARGRQDGSAVRPRQEFQFLPGDFGLGRIGGRPGTSRAPALTDEGAGSAAAASVVGAEHALAPLGDEHAAWSPAGEGARGAHHNDRKGDPVPHATASDWQRRNASAATAQQPASASSVDAPHAPTTVAAPSDMPVAGVSARHPDGIIPAVDWVAPPRQPTPTATPYATPAAPIAPLPTRTQALPHGRAEPRIEVHIGRVELHAPRPPQASPRPVPRRSAPAPRMRGFEQLATARRYLDRFPR